MSKVMCNEHLLENFYCQREVGHDGEHGVLDGQARLAAGLELQRIEAQKACAQSDKCTLILGGGVTPTLPVK